MLSLLLIAAVAVQYLQPSQNQYQSNQYGSDTCTMKSGSQYPGNVSARGRHHQVAQAGTASQQSIW